MLESIKSMKLKYKLFLPNILYLMLLGTVVYFFIISNSMIRQLSQEQASSSAFKENLSQAVLNIKAYAHEEISFTELEQRYQALKAELESGDRGIDMKTGWNQVENIHHLRETNAQIDNRFFELTNSSIKNSNGFIKQVSAKLADEQQRSQVSTLERRVIAGAVVNTSANYDLQVLFGRMKRNLDVKSEILSYFDTLIKNVEKDIEGLAGTPFELLPVEAKKLNLEARDLTLTYIKNLDEEKDLKQSILNRIDKDIDKLNEAYLEKSAGFFEEVKALFRYLIIIITAISGCGILISIFTAKSVSGLLSRVVADLLDASDQVASASAQVSGSSQSLAEGSSEQAAAIQQTSSSLEEMSSMTRQNADNAEEAKNRVAETDEIAAKVNRHMGDMGVAMAEITRSSEETGKIIKTIDEIAFQTNLLALNAAVEAARAGEAGAGFAVVADEVRNLAMRAADAARNTAELIENTIKSVQNGSELTQLTQAASDENMENAAKVGELVAEIAAASKEQAQGIQQVNTAVSQMEKVTQSNAANAEESASAAEELSAQAEQMKTIIEKLISMAGSGETWKGAGGSKKDGPPARPANSPRPEGVIPLEDADFKDF